MKERSARLKRGRCGLGGEHPTGAVSQAVLPALSQRNERRLENHALIIEGRAASFGVNAWSCVGRWSAQMAEMSVCTGQFRALALPSLVPNWCCSTTV